MFLGPRWLKEKLRLARTDRYLHRHCHRDDTSRGFPVWNFFPSSQQRLQRYCCSPVGTRGMIRPRDRTPASFYFVSFSPSAWCMRRRLSSARRANKEFLVPNYIKLTAVSSRFLPSFFFLLFLTFHSLSLSLSLSLARARSFFFSKSTMVRAWEKFCEFLTPIGRFAGVYREQDRSAGEAERGWIF